MNITVKTSSSQYMDVVAMHIDTGLVYDFEQVVVARLTSRADDACVFSIRDDSRCMYESVAVNLTNDEFMGLSNDIADDKAVMNAAMKVMFEYRKSNYVYK